VATPTPAACLCTRSRISPVPRAYLRTRSELEDAIELAGFEIVLSEDHTPALRTFVAMLVDRCRGLDKVGSFFCTSKDRGDIKMSALGYLLTISKKPVK